MGQPVGEMLSHRFAPLRNRSYRALFAAQGFSLVGSWMQELARSWIVLSMLGKASSIGMLMLVGALPNLLFANVAGVLADRKNARAILV